jgi:hypothetical protein
MYRLLVHPKGAFVDEVHEAVEDVDDPEYSALFFDFAPA